MKRILLVLVIGFSFLIKAEPQNLVQFYGYYYTYYIVIDEQATGPYTVSDLGQLYVHGLFTNQSQVWREGMTNWMTAGTLAELAYLFSVPYFVVINDQTAGPYSISVLSQLSAHGQFTDQSQVWREGMINWMPAGTLMELAHLFCEQ